MSTCLLEKQNIDDVEQYLREIRQFPLLTPQQEQALAQRCASGDEEAIRQMVNSNLRLVVSVAKSYAGRGVPLLDLCQEGSIGLITAAKKFDCTKDTRFSTYATKWIRHCISRYIADHAELIRIPEHTAQQIRQLKELHTRLQRDSGSPPTLRVLAQQAGLSEKKAQQLLGYVPEICSLDLLTGDGGDVPLGTLMEDVRAPEPQAALVRQELEQLLDRLMDKLSDRQRQILRLHFGMEDGICHSLEEIGSRLNISKERARQVEKQALEKLQTLGAGFGLEDFLNDMD